jgi:hypothetical protein
MPGTLVQVCNEAEDIPCKVEIELERVRKELAFPNYGGGKAWWARSPGATNALPSQVHETAVQGGASGGYRCVLR